MDSLIYSRNVYWCILILKFYWHFNLEADQTEFFELCHIPYSKSWALISIVQRSRRHLHRSILGVVGAFHIPYSIFHNLWNWKLEIGKGELQSSPFLYANSNCLIFSLWFRDSLINYSRKVSVVHQEWGRGHSDKEVWNLWLNRKKKHHPCARLSVTSDETQNLERLKNIGNWNMEYGTF